MTYPTIRPEIIMDFANSRQLDPRINFSRPQTSGQATYINPDTGLLSYAYAHQPRFEKDGLLIEESRTNYIPNSTDFTGWLQYVTASLALSSAVTTPDGGTSSNLFTADDGIAYVQLPYVIPGDTVAYLTLFVKAANENVLRLNSSRSSTMRGLFDMTTGLWSPLAGSADDYTAEAYPNGWWKLTVKGFIAGPSTITLYVAAPDITSAGTDAFYMWGCQIEHGSFPSSLIPTSGSALTRAADNANITGDNFSSWYNQSEGTLLQFFVPKGSSVTYAGRLSLNSTNYTGSYINPTTRIVHMYRTSTGENVLLKTGVYVNTKVNIGMSYDSVGFSGCHNGTAVQTSSSIVGTQSTLTQLLVGLGTQNISRLSYYPQRLTDSELQAITL